MAGAGDEVTGLLRAWSDGDEAARMRGERPGHTLQPTALVHEAFLRLIDQKEIVWQNRAQFLGVASEMMRRILVDHARAHKMAKRSGRWVKVTIDDAVAGTQPRDIDLLNLDEAMRRLAEFDPRKSRIAELRFFGGLTLEETSHVLGLSVATVERDWQAARAWLYVQIKGGR